MRKSLVLSCLLSLVGGCGETMRSGPREADAGHVDPVDAAAVADAGGRDGRTIADAGTIDAGEGPLESAPAWVRTFGGALSDNATSVASDAAGNVYIVGAFAGMFAIDGSTASSAGNVDAYVVSFDRSGAFRWLQAFGSGRPDLAQSLAVDEAGDVYVVGFFNDVVVIDSVRLESRGQADAFLVKLAGDDGSVRWARNYGGPYSESARAVSVGAGRVCIAGDYQGGFRFNTADLPAYFAFDIFVGCVSASDASHLWAGGFGSYGSDVGTAVQVAEDGAVLVGVSVEYDVTFGDVTVASVGRFDAAVVRFDEGGQAEWAIPIASEGGDEVKSLALGDDGAVYGTGVFSAEITLGGETLRSAGRHDGFVLRIEPDGTVAWATQFGGSQLDQPVGIAASGPSLYVGGRFEGVLHAGELELIATESFDGLLLALDASSGAPQRLEAVVGEGADMVSSVAPDGAGGVYAVGTFAGEVTTSAGSGTSAGELDVVVLHSVDPSLE